MSKAKTEKYHNAICNFEKELMGDHYVDLKPVLKRALTVGELKDLLKDVSDSALVKVAIPSNFEPGMYSPNDVFAINTSEVVGDCNVFEIVGVAPSDLQEFLKAEMLD